MSSFQLLPKPLHATRIRIFLRRDPKHRFKGALKMKRAMAKFFAQLRQRNWLIQSLFDIPANSFDHLLLRIATPCLWAATQARAESRRLGFFRLPIKSHILAPWPLRRARRPAVH